MSSFIESGSGGFPRKITGTVIEGSAGNSIWYGIAADANQEIDRFGTVYIQAEPALYPDLSHIVTMHIIERS